MIKIYTDGASSGNPGPGGFGAIITDDENIKEIGGREERTTNNRMEMRAVIESLRETQEGVEVEIHTDSEYLMKGATIWIKKWQENNWKTKAKKPVLNKDLWEELWREIQKRKVVWKKVLSHSGHKLNDRCDEIATGFALGKKVELR